MQIAHITDLHLDESYPFKESKHARERFERVIDDIRKRSIQHIVCTGDIGEGEGIQYFFEYLKDLNLDLTLGNHDLFDKMYPYHPKSCDRQSGKLYHSSQLAHHRLIFLDSSSGLVDSQQLLWLQEELKVKTPIIIFMHHPIIRVPYKVDEIGRLKNREEVLETLSQTSLPVNIYCGHYHMESTLTYENITQHITPAIAYQIHKTADHIEIDTSLSGYRSIELSADRHTSQIHLLENAD
jgi:Icc protein